MAGCLPITGDSKQHKQDVLLYQEGKCDTMIFYFITYTNEDLMRFYSGALIATELSNTNRHVWQIANIMR
jgi:hypothetical protein